MSEISASPGLRRKLIADALISGAGGLLLILGAGPLAQLMRLPRPLLFWAGVALLPFAAVNASLGLRRRAPRRALLAIMLCNACWAADSLLAVACGWLQPSLTGMAVVLAQALAVAALADAEYHDLRDRRAEG
jgi:CHASE2 domain-containing sensor protein